MKRGYLSTTLAVAVAAGIAATGITVALSSPPGDVVAEPTETPKKSKKARPTTTGPSTPSADKSWKLTRDGHLVASAEWDGENEVLSVIDERDDGYSVMYVIWRPDRYGARHRHWTDDDTEKTRDDYQVQELDGTPRRFQMCLGTYALKPKNRVILASTCSKPHSFRD